MVKNRGDMEVEGTWFKQTMEIVSDPERPIKDQRVIEFISYKAGTYRPSDIVALLKVCAKQKNLQQGSQIHALILKDGSSEKECLCGQCFS